ncbi:MAG: Bacteroidetes-specific putative rane protein [Bacteroidetes bacterium]|jgi:type IX secretion system PorP/SprF family membrane protein|nr:Bacteroidetes-specific putative rane protein [Bacteroidota bacterium]
MKTKKSRFKTILLLSVLFSTCDFYAQQLPQYTQYMLNDFVMNPAIAGKGKDYWDCRSNNRYQWKGITDAPRTYILSAHGPFKNRKMGIGGTLFTDIVGPTRRVGFNMAYSYHLKLNDKYQLNLGLSAGILQYSVDGHKLLLHDNDDLILVTQYRSAITPDFGAGIYLHSDKLFVSVSVPQFYEAQVKLDGITHSTLSRIRPHLYTLAGYTFDIGEDFQVEPSVLVKYLQPTPVKVDVGVRGIYQKKIWLGLSYRTNDAISAMLGYMHNNWLMVGYSYDYTTTNLQKYSSGTHEITLGLRFSKPDSKSAVKTD